MVKRAIQIDAYFTLLYYSGGDMRLGLRLTCQLKTPPKMSGKTTIEKPTSIKDTSTSSPFIRPQRSVECVVQQSPWRKHLFCLYTGSFPAKDSLISASYPVIGHFAFFSGVGVVKYRVAADGDGGARIFTAVVARK